jgi:hypothetical protein
LVLICVELIVREERSFDSISAVESSAACIDERAAMTRVWSIAAPTKLMIGTTERAKMTAILPSLAPMNRPAAARNLRRTDARDIAVAEFWFFRPR